MKDPVNVPGMTEYILSRLQPISPDENMRSSEDTERLNTGLGANTSVPQDQKFYRRHLLSGHLFAMQDLDERVIEEQWDEIKDKDWRRLVQTLTRYENFNAGEEGSGTVGELHDAPIGLKNRMRLVKILEGIFSGT